MNHIKSHFESEAQIYDQVILKLIPYYQEMIQALISAIPFPEIKKIKVLDLGCGTGTISKQIQTLYPNAEFTIVDLAQNMLQIAQAKINHPTTISHNTDFYHYTFHDKYDVIVSSLALHHLITDQDKQNFYTKIYQALNKNGLFFNADVVLASNDHLQSKYMKKWIEYMNRKCDMEEINNKWLVTYKTEDNPAKLIDQLTWLKQIGFQEVDVLWKYYNFAVYGGYKKEQ